MVEDERRPKPNTPVMWAVREEEEEEACSPGGRMQLFTQGQWWSNSCGRTGQAGATADGTRRRRFSYV